MKLFKDIKYKRQRIKRGYSDDMCFGLYYTILEILPQMIETMRKMQHGYAEEEFEEVKTFPKDWVQKELINLKFEFKDKDFKQPNLNDSFTKWQLILKRISYCLIQADETQTDIENKYQEEYDKQFWNINNIEEDKKLSVKEWFKKHTEPFKYDENGNPKLYKYKTYPVDEDIYQKWRDENDKINQYREDMKNEAFDLLKKYFWHLWD